MSSVLVVAGESSGDKYGAALLHAFEPLAPGTTAFGIGGPRLRAAGLESLHSLEDLAVVGLAEVVTRIPRLRRMLSGLAREARARRPAAAVLIDAPDFNLRLAPRLRAAGIPVLYYVSPTVWAWRRGRLRTIARSVDKMLLIFPFEREIYAARGIPHAYVGHPLLDKIRPAAARGEFARTHGLDPERPIVAILPGSRRGEVAAHLKVLVAAARDLRAEPGAQFALVRAETIETGLLADAAAAVGPDGCAVTDAAYDAMAAADLVISACGTANLEAAVLGTPLIAFYRVSPLTYALARPFVRIRDYSIVNILAGRPIIPELIQSGFTAAAVARTARRLLASPAALAEMTAGFDRIRETLAIDDPSGRAARELAGLIAGRASAGHPVTGL